MLCDVCCVICDVCCVLCAVCTQGWHRTTSTLQKKGLHRPCISPGRRHMLMRRFQGWKQTFFTSWSFCCTSLAFVQASALAFVCSASWSEFVILFGYLFKDSATWTVRVLWNGMLMGYTWCGIACSVSPGEMDLPILHGGQKVTLSSRATSSGRRVIAKDASIQL